jgi:hypothetical protein
MPSAIEIAKEYFPYASPEVLDHIIWNHTGYPSFWNIPKDGNTPHQCFRKQLQSVADQISGGKTMNDLDRECMERMRRGMEEYHRKQGDGGT